MDKAPGLNKEEFLESCKVKALKDLQDGKNSEEVLVTFMADLRKNPMTAGHLGLDFGVMSQVGGLLSRNEEIRSYIKGFN